MQADSRGRKCSKATTPMPSRLQSYFDSTIQLLTSQNGRRALRGSGVLGGWRGNDLSSRTWARSELSALGNPCFGHLLPTRGACLGSLRGCSLCLLPCYPNECISYHILPLGRGCDRVACDVSYLNTNFVDGVASWFGEAEFWSGLNGVKRLCGLNCLT